MQRFFEQIMCCGPVETDSTQRGHAPFQRPNRSGPVSPEFPHQQYQETIDCLASEFDDGEEVLAGIILLNDTAFLAEKEEMYWEIYKAKNRLSEKLGDDKACVNTILIQDIKCSPYTFNTFIRMISHHISKSGLKSLKLEHFPHNSALNHPY